MDVKIPIDMDLHWVNRSGIERSAVLLDNCLPRKLIAKYAPKSICPAHLLSSTFDQPEE